MQKVIEGSYAHRILVLLALRLKSSLLAGVWVWLCSVYKESLIYRALAACGAAFCRWLDQSLLVGMLFHRGPVPKAWEQSLVCRGAEGLMNLPGRGLHWFYEKTRKLWDGSFFAGLFFRLSDSSAGVEALLLAALWVIPYAKWNNVYNLLGYFIVLLFLLLRQMRWQTRLELRKIGPYPVLLLLTAVLAVFSSTFPGLSSRYLIYHVISALCVLVTVNSVRREGHLLALCMGISLALLAMSGYGVYQRITGKLIYYAYMVDTSMNAGMPSRVYSWFDNPNTFAQVLVLLTPAAAVLLLRSRYAAGRLLGLAALVLSVTALAVTYSRTSYIGFAVEALVFVCLWKPSLLPIGGALCVLALPFLPDSVLNRIRTIGSAGQDSTATSRLPLMKAGLKIIRSRPLWGAGLGTDAMRAYGKEQLITAALLSFPHTHNTYIQVWVELGLGGFLCFMLGMLDGLRNMFRACRADSGIAGITAIAVVSSLCGSLVGGLADFLWHYPRVMGIFWLIFALGLSAVKVASRQSETDTDTYNI